MYRTVFVAFVLLAGGCAGLGLPSPEASKAIEKAKTVGVISAVGHKFALQKIGVTVFGNELNEVAIDSWGIDDAVVNTVSALLNKRFTVKKITFPNGAFASYESPGGAFRDRDAELRDIVRKIAGASQQCDLYVVVTRAGAPFGGTNQVVSGLGMVEAGRVLNPDNVHLFAVTTVHVYDGYTFESLHWQRTGFELGAALGGTAINAPNRRLDRTWWPATPQAVHNDKLKAATRALQEDGVAKTIPKIMRMETMTQATVN